MKLQIKDAGAWRNLVTFTSKQEAAVRRISVDLIKALDEQKTVMRIVEGDTPLLWCRGPEFEWVTR